MKIECAVEGLEQVDRELLKQELERIANVHRNDPNKKLVSIDYDNYSIRFEEIETTIKKVEVKADDFIIKK